MAWGFVQEEGGMAAPGDLKRGLRDAVIHHDCFLFI